MKVVYALLRVNLHDMVISGLFLHRRKAETTADSFRKVSLLLAVLKHIEWFVTNKETKIAPGLYRLSNSPKLKNGSSCLIVILS